MKRKKLKLLVTNCIKCKYFSFKKNKTHYNLWLIGDLKNRRFKWTPIEDQVLLFWKLGTMIIKQVKSHAFLSYGIKDVVRSIFGKVCDL